MSLRVRKAAFNIKSSEGMDFPNNREKRRQSMNNNSFLKGVIFALLAIYVISPLDLAPGVVDDLMLVVLTAFANGRKPDNKFERPPEKQE